MYHNDHRDSIPKHRRFFTCSMAGALFSLVTTRHIRRRNDFQIPNLAFQMLGQLNTLTTASPQDIGLLVNCKISYVNCASKYKKYIIK
jgi:hypothetical protein